MAKATLLNLKGEKVKEIKLNDEIFGIEPNNQVMYDAVVRKGASLRQGTHAVKDRSEVSGGGIKPWRQKGTGRARQGSTRAVQWVGGGHAHAIQPRDYGFKINKKERELALKSALSYKVIDKELVVVDKIELASLKTTEAKNLIKSLNIAGNILFVTNDDNENLFMACRNLGYTQVLVVDEINVLDLVYADYVVIEEAAVKTLEEGLK